MKKLSDLKPTEKCIVESVSGQGMIRRRLFDMGITPGAEIYVRKVAPLGDPIELTLRGYELSIRKEEADQVVIEKQVAEETSKRANKIESIA